MRITVRPSLLAILALALAACSYAPLPTIAEVESDAVVTTDVATVRSGEPTTLTIRGSGFGERRGLNRLFYGGIEVADAVIASWSDAAIELAFFHPAEIVGSSGLELRSTSMSLEASRKGGPLVAPDEQRFEVRTLGGSSESEPVRLVSVSLWLDYASGPGAEVGVSVEAFDLFGHPWSSLELTLSANRGTLAASTLVTNDAGYATTTLTTVDALPHAVAASYQGRRVAQDATLPYTASPSYHDVAAGLETTIRTTLSDATAAPVADASLDWVLVPYDGLRYGWHDLGTHATDASGAVELAIPALDAWLDFQLFVIEDGYVVASLHVNPTLETDF